MNKKLNLWLIRIYALIILIVALTDILEGAAFKLVLGIASTAIIIQSIIISNKNEDKVKKYTWRNCIEYIKYNPREYWFKRKLYGWGWVPVKWQGWLVVAIGLAIFISSIYIGEADDAPGAVVIGFLLMLAIIFFFGYKKGEKPRWSWGR